MSVATKTAKKVSAKSIARGEYKKLMKTMREAKADPEKLTSKAKIAAHEVAQKTSRAIKNISGEDVDRAAGRVAEKTGKELGSVKDKVVGTAKSVGRMTGATAKRVRDTGSWIAKNPIKSAVGAGAAYAVGKAISDDDDTERAVEKIKAKPASERTPAERRLLRIMEED